MRHSLPPRPRAAFTLLEMIITVGLMALIAALIVVALGGVKEGANRTKSAAALRQMMAGYSMYSSDHEQRLMPGYVGPANLANLGITAKTPAGVDMANPLDVSSYVWRLAPYVDNRWETMMVDYQNKEILARLNSELLGGTRGAFADLDPVYGFGTAELSPVPNDLGIGRVPAYGLNSIYVGGDDTHGGADVTARNPWANPYNKIAATRLSEVKNPARLIVFAPAKHHDFDQVMANPPITELDFGSPELRSPVIDINGPVTQWEIVDNAAIVSGGDFSAGGGVPVSRTGKGLLPTGHLDGSVTTEDINNMQADPKKWNPFAVGVP